ncbi:MAG: hypothetical protein ACP5N2_03425 [Candidatus Nanoarchaeia archaeon]
MAKIMNAVFGIGIAVIVFIVVLLGIQAFYPAPEYSKYCNDSFYSKPFINTMYDCPRNITVDECISITENEGINSEEYKAQDEAMMACNNKYEEANKTYSKTFFILASILGLILIIAAYLLLNIMSLSAGIAFSGIVLLVVAFVKGWKDTDDTVKFLIGLVIAAVIIYLALKINSRFSEEKQTSKPLLKKKK